MQSLDRHNASKMHETRSSPGVKKYTCECGKYYIHQQSLRNHKMKCTFIKEPVITRKQTFTVDQLIIELKQDIDSQKIEFQKEQACLKQAFEEERQEMKLAFEESMKEQINKILDKHAGTTNNNNNTTNNNIETQNITININAFGNENTDYLDDKAILACIGRVYKSIPTLLEKIHFDPKHPENHNIKITNKKLPYASVMGNNQKWKTVDRKDAIDTMVNNSYNILDGKYKENKDKISPSKQQHFRGFQSKFDTEDKELMKEIKSEVDMMVLNGI
jgi:hypothetical protein